MQTNGLYSPPGQGPGPGHGLTHPPAAWFTSLHRPHYRNGDLPAGSFKVQVYDLDQPMAGTTDLSPSRISTSPESLQGHNVRNQQTEENKNLQHVRSVSPDQSLNAELGHNCLYQSSPGHSGAGGLRKIPIISDHDNHNIKRPHLVKSASSNGILGFKQISVDAQDYLMPRCKSQELCSSTESLESLLPELVPVVPLGDAVGQNTFPMKGANDTLKSCEEEKVLKSPQCILQEFKNPEILQEEMEKNIQGKICREKNDLILQSFKM